MGNRRQIPGAEVHRLTGEREQRSPVLYARVASHGQEEEVERPKERLHRAFPGAELHREHRLGLTFDRPGSLASLKAV